LIYKSGKKGRWRKRTLQPPDVRCRRRDCESNSKRKGSVGLPEREKKRIQREKDRKDGNRQKRLFIRSRYNNNLRKLKRQKARAHKQEERQNRKTR